jgi:hypothetical protein
LLNEAQARLPVPVREKHAFASVSGLLFEGIIATIDGFVTCRELMVGVSWEGRNWDTLLRLEVDAQRRHRGGFICPDCDPKDRSVFPTLGPLWRDHLFEPVLVCVNEKLAVAETICLYGSPSDGHTYARLLRRDDHDGMMPTARLPVRVQSG